MNQPDSKKIVLRQEITAENAALNAATDRACQAERRAKAELEVLKAEYQSLVFDLAMNRSSDVSRKFELRTEIRGLEYDLADLDLLHYGFEAEVARAIGKQRQLAMLVKAVAQYDELKERIQDEGTGISWVSDLKTLAKKLGCEQDAEDFLSELQQGTAA